MQRMLRVSENTYSLVTIEAKRRGKPISQTADALIISGLELDGDPRTIPSPKPEHATPLPGQTELTPDAGPIVPLPPMSNPNLTHLREQIRNIETNPAAPDEPEVLYAVVVEMTGHIVKEKMTAAEAERFLSDHNIEGDLKIMEMS